jgi:dolichol-phosphate mannosyltransferase
MTTQVFPDTRLWLQASLPGVFVVIPTYNEASNLPVLARQIFSQSIPNLHLVVVDDQSPDGTGEVAEQLAWLHPGRVHVIHRSGKAGLGTAYREGFRYALEQDADYIIQMDADFSHSPNYLPQLLESMQWAEVAVGSRYVTGGKLDPSWSWQRNLLSRWANSVYVRLILGLQVQDATAGFKCWSRRALAEILEQPVSSSGYIFQVEMAYLAEKLGLRVKEIPIFFEDRRQGLSKMSNSVKLEAVWRPWVLRWRYRSVHPNRQGIPGGMHTELAETGRKAVED